MTRTTTATIIAHSIKVVLSPDGGHTIPDPQGVAGITGNFFLVPKLSLGTRN